jgi:hypothetical protein
MDGRDWTIKAARALWGDAWQGPLAAFLGVSRRTVGYWAAGARSPRPVQVEALALHMVERARFLERAATAAPLDAAGSAWATVHGIPQVKGGDAVGPLMGEQWRGDPPPTSGVPMPHAMTEAELEQYVTADFGPLQAPPDHLIEGRYHTTEAPAAAPAPAPAAKVLTEKQLARIERALEARGVRVLLGPPGDPTIRARAEADRAAGRVVYAADLPQHADLIGE